MREIRAQAKTEEVDYLFLMNCLSDYKRPRDKLTALLKSNEIIRVKKGIYVFGEKWRQRPYSLEVLANLIYGPSYISFEYALAYYNLIPEGVTRVTSASNKRSKLFSTPVGEFVYHFVPLEKYPFGITWKAVDACTHFLIATQEKALADYIARLRPFENKENLFEYLVDGVRIDPTDLFKLRQKQLVEIAKAYQNINVTLLCDAIRK